MPETNTNEPTVELKPKLARRNNWKIAYTKILVLTARNVADEEIARQVGYNPQYIRDIRGKEDFKQNLAILRQKTIAKTIERESERDLLEDARKILLDAAMPAAKRIIRWSRSRKLLDPRKRLQVDICFDILDRVGLKAIEVVETRERASSPEEIASMKATLAELEHLTERLTNQNSRFLVVKPETESSVTDDSSTSDVVNPETPAVPSALSS